MNCCYLGPSYDKKSIKTQLTDVGAKFKMLSSKKLIEATVNELKQQKIVGWFQGRMEFGPRALGNRSIIADPRSNKMQKKLNLKIKFRESFRPFAPVVLEDKCADWFDLPVKSKYMSIVAQVNKKQLKVINNSQLNLKGLKKLQINRSKIPAVTHIDNSARIQTVSKQDNSILFNLINCFYKKTKCPILVNTSFNIRGEPIVSSISDAFFCFMETDMDILVIDNFFLRKEDQNKELKKLYTKC